MRASQGPITMMYFPAAPCENESSAFPFCTEIVFQWFCWNNSTARAKTSQRWCHLSRQDSVSRSRREALPSFEGWRQPAPYSMAGRVPLYPFVAINSSGCIDHLLNEIGSRQNPAPSKTRGDGRSNHKAVTLNAAMIKCAGRFFVWRRGRVPRLRQ